MPDLSLVDLSFSGRLPETSPTLTAISEAEIDDRVTLERREVKWLVLDAQGRVLGRMAGTWAPPADTYLVSGKVGAIVRWRKADNEEAFQAYIKRDEWEAILPEFVFRKNDGL
jgi:ATP-dependent DNA helicase RecQ